MTKISIIGGAGRVGSATAFAILMNDLCNEMVLIDIAEDKVKGEALDLQHAFGNKKIIGAADYSLIKDSDLILITAGVPRKPDMTRDDLFGVNQKIVHLIAEQVKTHAPNSIVVLTTNPLDKMAHEFFKASGFDARKVIGESGELDSMRFRWILSQKLNVPFNSIEAYAEGEHGEKMKPLIDNVKVNGEKVEIPDREKVLDETIHAALPVIKLKGGTAFAPAIALTTMAKSILNDEKKQIACSVFVPEQDKYEGKLVKLGKEGVIQ